MRIDSLFRNICVVLSIALAAIASSSATAQNFQAGAQFWSPPGSSSQCHSNYDGIGTYKLSKTLTRRPYPNDDGVNFAGHYSMWLVDTIAGRNVSKHKANLLKIAEAQTYTKANLKTKWSPIYVQSNLIRMTAMYILVLEGRGQLTPEERGILISWGDKMIPGQKGSKQNGSSDSLSASGIAMMAWGNIKEDTKLVEAGYKKFLKGYNYVMQSVGKLQRHPKHQGVSLSTLSLENEYNIALQHAVEGAAILKNLGIDIASEEIKGKTLHDAVEWWTSVITELPVQGKWTRARSHNHHVGWIPIYTSVFSEQSASAELKS